MSDIKAKDANGKKDSGKVSCDILGLGSFILMAYTVWKATESIIASIAVPTVIVVAMVWKCTAEVISPEAAARAKEIRKERGAIEGAMYLNDSIDEDKYKYATERETIVFSVISVLMALAYFGWRYLTAA